MRSSSTLIEQLKFEGIRNEAVLAAMARVPRHRFVRDEMQDFAYADEALPIECGQTISQPFVVARMTELLLGDQKLNSVLEVGTGSGYQAAILAQLVPNVYTIERYETLHEQAKKRFLTLGYTNIHCMHGDGYEGWPEKAPFDGIIVTAGATEVPDLLKEQLADGGRLVIPVGVQFGSQELLVITRHDDQFSVERYDPVVFVPLLHGVSKE